MVRQKPFGLEDASRIPARGGSTRIRRFDGLSRRTADWDGLRKDTQLWSDDADCVVHFYGYRASQRGPSLRVSFDAVQKCRYLIKQCLHTAIPTLKEEDHSDSGYGSSISLSTIAEQTRPTYELYIPAPPDSTRDQAFAYHLVTRNVLAYAVGKPVVGEKLSEALTGLWRRLREWLPKGALLANFTAYLEKQGYLNFAENSEHALACLKFAEAARLRDMWIDAFVHCVGMHERLDLSPEFAGLSKTTSALVTRASLEMDLHVARIVRVLGCFLEEELGAENLGLSKAARDHLDHFRSFLHAYYVDKLGYFPPTETAPWAKRPWKGMCEDFQKMYDYLVDMESGCDWTNSRAVTGGVCVTQNVQNFDLRHGYTPLPHPLPLLPQTPTNKRRSLSSQRSLRTLKLGRTNSIPEAKITAGQALAIATNCLDSEVMACPLVQEYQRFERQKPDKLDIVEARKVRWLLIYSILQMLMSIMKAPKEVRDTEKLSYPLCVLTTGCPPWAEEDSFVDEESEGDAPSPVKASWESKTLDALEGRSSIISIHPDCEADNADDFFALNSISRSASTMSLTATPAPLRITAQLSRTASIRSSMHSSVQALQKSVVGGLSRRNSIRRNSIGVEPRKVRSHCEIVIEHYGNGLFGEEEVARPQTPRRSSTGQDMEFTDPLLAFDFGLAATNDEPVLEHCQMGLTSYVIESQDTGNIGRSPCDSWFSTVSGGLPDSNRSSSYLSECDSTATELSSVDGDSYKRQSDIVALDTLVDSSDDYQVHQTTPKQLCYRPSNPSLSIKTSFTSVNAGCYTPTGMINLPVSKFSQREIFGAEEIHSETSSLYAEEGVQAADIEEEETRGRRRSRGLDQLSHFGVVRGDGSY